MKSILSFLLLLTGFAAAAQTTPAPVEILLVKQTEHDFGKIPQGKPVFHNFEIVNTGNEPLTLQNVQATCGCTTPEWSREPIAPGATSVIKVGYNAAAEGAFDKPITITYKEGQTKVLHIKGTVWKAPETSAPVNPSVQFLKKTN
ncbi:MAG: DUF1573 domain-containing protein [Chitinophagaceae bacterium]